MQVGWYSTIFFLWCFIPDIKVQYLIIMSVHFYSDDEENDNLDEVSTNIKVTGRDSVVFAVECCEGISNL